MKQDNERRKGQLFKKTKLNIMYGCYGNQNKTLWDGPVIIYCDNS